MNEEIKYITSFSGKQYDSSEIADIISRNLEEHANYYAKKGINRDDFVNSVDMLYKGLVDKTYTDVISGFKGPAGNILPQAVRFMKTVLQNATPVESEVEDLGYYNPNIFWNTFKTVYNVKDNYDFKDWKPGGVYNQSSDHSDATQLMSALITNKIIPTLNQYKYKEGVTQFANVTEAENAWKAYAEALKTKKANETGLIGNSDKALATQLGGPSLSNMLDGIAGVVIQQPTAYEQSIASKAKELTDAGMPANEANDLARKLVDAQNELILNNAQDQIDKYNLEKEERDKKIQLQDDVNRYDTHVQTKWSDSSNTGDGSEFTYVLKQKLEDPLEETLKNGRYFVQGYLMGLVTKSEDGSNVILTRKNKVMRMSISDFNKVIDYIIRNDQKSIFNIPIGDDISTSLDSFNPNTGYITCYDNKNNRVFRESLYVLGDDPRINFSNDFKNLLFNRYRQVVLKRPVNKFKVDPVKSKYGSKLKALKCNTGNQLNYSDSLDINNNNNDWGDLFDNHFASFEIVDSIKRVNSLLSDSENNLSQEEKDRLIHERSRLQEDFEWNKLRGYEIARGLGTLFDVTAAGTSFAAGAGNIAAPILGLIGTGLHAYADWNDPSLSADERKKRLYWNLGLTGALFIPGGGSLRTAGGLAKAGKGVGAIKEGLKATAKWGKRTMVGGGLALGGYNTVTTAPQTWDQVKRVVDPDENITLGEFRDLLYNTSIFAGTAQNAQYSASRLGAHARETGHAKMASTLNKIAYPFANRNASMALNTRLTPGEGMSNPKISVSNQEFDISPEIYSKLVKVSNDYATKHQVMRNIPVMKQKFNEQLAGKFNEVINEEALKISDQEIAKLMSVLGGNIDSNTSINLKGLLFDIETEFPLSSDRLSNLQSRIPLDAEKSDIIKELRTIFKINPEVTKQDINTFLIQASRNGDLIDLSNPTNRAVMRDIKEYPGVARSHGFTPTSKYSITKPITKFEGYIGSGYNKRVFIGKIKDSLNKFLYATGNDSDLSDAEYEKLFRNIAKEVGYTGDEVDFNLINKVDDIINTFKATNKNLNDVLKGVKNSQTSNNNTTRSSNTSDDNTTDMLSRTEIHKKIQELKKTVAELDKEKNELYKLVDLDDNGNPIINDEYHRYANKYWEYDAAKSNLDGLERTLQIFSKKNGGTLNKLKSLRQSNFTTDTAKKFSKGGIVKAQNGDNTNEWITKYNPHGGLDRYRISANPYDSNVKDNPYHINGSDLSSATNYITKYINNQDQITGDIQSYITDNNLTDVNDFISKYNEDITNLHNKWKAKKYTYGEYGASDINNLYKKLYKSTANQDQLGWDENLKDVFGATTNARRVIVRNGELSTLTPEQLAKRTHTVKVNGQDVKVYVNADGTLTTTFTSNPSSTTTGNNGNGNDNGNGNGNETIHRPSSDEEDGKENDEKDTEDYSYWGTSYDPYLASMNKAYPDLLDLARFIDNKRNNKRIWELGLKKKFSYKSPIQLKRNVYGDFGALTNAQQEGNALMSTMSRMASLTNNPEDAAAMMMDAQLRQNNIVSAGRKLDNAAMAQSAKESQQTEEAVYKYNKEVGDYNMAQAVAKFNHDLDITSAYHSADTTNNNNYTMGLEKRARENWRDVKDAIRDTSLLQLENMRKRLVLNTPVIQDYNERIAVETDPSKKLQLQQAKARELEKNEKRWGKYFFDMQIAILLGKPLPDVSEYMKAQSNDSKTTGSKTTVTDVSDQPPTIKLKNKNGGKLTNHKIKRSAEDLKELRKQIKFNITTNQKALDNLSKSVLLELKKMMDI